MRTCLHAYASTKLVLQKKLTNISTIFTIIKKDEGEHQSYDIVSVLIRRDSAKQRVCETNPWTDAVTFPSRNNEASPSDPLAPVGLPHGESGFQTVRGSKVCISTEA